MAQAQNVRWRMNPEVKAQWVAALRSGNYKQGTGRLRLQPTPYEQERFCCLGVLCNLHAQAHPEIAAKETNALEYMGADEVLPDAVKKWAGLESNRGGAVRIKGEYSSLDVHNDGGATFKEIAHAINTQL